MSQDWVELNPHRGTRDATLRQDVKVWVALDFVMLCCLVSSFLMRLSNVLASTVFLLDWSIY